MTYATWQLRFINDDYLDGPESTIVQNGGTAKAVFTLADVSLRGTILGIVSGNLSGLEAWNFKIVSKIEAELFINNNYDESLSSDYRSLQEALNSLN